MEKQTISGLNLRYVVSSRKINKFQAILRLQPIFVSRKGNYWALNCLVRPLLSIIKK